MNLLVHIVDKQLSSYNSQDFETFAACYHRDIISYDLENLEKLENMSGANFFSHYRKKFAENPQLYCEVTDRIVHGDLVIDKEYIVGYRGVSHREMVIYKVEGGLISKMWFSKEIEETSK